MDLYNNEAGLPVLWENSQGIVFMSDFIIDPVNKGVIPFS